MAIVRDAEFPGRSVGANRRGPHRTRLRRWRDLRTCRSALTCSRVSHSEDETWAATGKRTPSRFRNPSGASCAGSGFRETRRIRRRRRDGQRTCSGAGGVVSSLRRGSSEGHSVKNCAGRPQKFSNMSERLDRFDSFAKSFRQADLFGRLRPLRASVRADLFGLFGLRPLRP